MRAAIALAFVSVVLALSGCTPYYHHHYYHQHYYGHNYSYHYHGTGRGGHR